MSPPLCNTRRPGSSTNQIGKIRKKFLCVWSAAVELTTTDRLYEMFCAQLKTFLFVFRAYVTSSYRLCDSFGGKVYANTYLLTYLLMFLGRRPSGLTLGALGF